MAADAEYQIPELMLRDLVYLGSGDFGSPEKPPVQPSFGRSVMDSIAGTRFVCKELTIKGA